ncbi:N-terminal domain of NEFA-interacting nuclear protein NIP30-domain-containing protein [Syncephalis fuscata]|nr:N-terminal domain of NEFA-interacting nuclear protein NIP30-domain-containing protein [Syncephalis fuscata]
MEGDLPIQRNFVSQDTLDEQRRAREEEWRKVHATDGEVPPMEEAPYDPRPLYEKLQEQRQKKEDAFQEATRLANLVHRLDDEEIGFLQSIQSEETAKEQEKRAQEKVELDAFRRAQATATDTIAPILPVRDTKEQVKTTSLLPSTTQKESTASMPNNKSRIISSDRQRQLLGKAVIRKRPFSAVNTDTSAKKEGKSMVTTNEPPTKQAKQIPTSSESTNTKKAAATVSKSVPNNPLMSLVAYSDDDSDDDSANSDN